MIFFPIPRNLLLATGDPLREKIHSKSKQPFDF